MIKVYIKSLNKIIGLKKIYLLLIWVSFFSSFNLNPVDFENFSIIHKIRFFLPLILILISFFLLRFNYKALTSFNTLIFTIFIIFYLLFNLINFDNPNSNVFWPIYMYLALLFIVSFVGEDEIKFIIKSTVLITVLAFTIFTIMSIDSMIERNQPNFYGIWGAIKGYSTFIDYPPRSSGLARYGVILFTVSYLFYLLKSHSNNIKILLLISISCFATLTILFHSRSITAILLIINSLIIFFYYKEISKKKIILLFAIILPLIASFTYEAWKNERYFQKNLEKGKTNSFTDETIKNFKDTIFRNQNKDDLNSFSSGRITIWTKVIDIIIEDPLKGHGAQADRLYINESVHNALLYAWLSGGIVSTLFILFCYLKILYFFFIFINSKILRVNLYFSSSVLVMIIIALRSLLDTSFAIYGVDYLFFLITFYYVNNTIKNK